MKRTVLISEMHQISKLIRHVRETDTIIATRPEVHNELVARRIIHKPGYDYAEVSEDEAIEWIKEWPKNHFGENNFIQLMKHENISVWWFMESWLYYSSIYFDSVRDVLLSVQLLNSIIKKEKPDEILFLDDGKPHSEIIKSISTQKNIKTTKVKLPFFRTIYNMKRTINTFFIKNFINFSYPLRKTAWKFSRLCHNRKANKDQRNKKVIFISTHAWERVRDEKGRITVREPFNTPIIEEFEKSKSFDILSVHIPIGNFLGLGEIWTRSKSPNFTVIEEYGNRRAHKKTSQSIKDIKSIWNKHKTEIQDSFVFDGVNISSILEKQFSCYFSTRLKGHMRDYYLIKEMLDNEKPSAVVYPGETSEFAKALFHLCREQNIITVGMQHGVLHKYLGWIHQKNEVSTKKTGPDICPIPDITMVYGPSYRETLIRYGKYPEKNVFVSGSQRFDRIVKSKKIFRKDKFFSEHSIDAGKKIITYVTSPIAAADAEMMNEALMNVVNKINNTHLVIKLHPSETPDVYEKIAKNLGIKPIILRDADLYEVLNATDIVVTHLSTAALEAMIFDKPVIVINLTGSADRVPYVKEGAAFGAYTKEELEKTLKALLESKRTYEKKRKFVKKFVYKYAYKTDGKASERIAKKIEELMKEKGAAKQI